MRGKSVSDNSAFFGSDNMRGVITSRDETRRILVFRDGIKIVSTVTNEVVYEKQDSCRDHLALGLSDDGDKVLYITYRRGSFFVWTSITVWDFKVNKSWTIDNRRSETMDKLSYNSDFSIVALSASHGISLTRPYRKERVWHRSISTHFAKSPVYVKSLRLDEEKGLVWVSHEQGNKALSIKDGSTQSIYGLPSEMTLQ